MGRKWNKEIRQKTPLEKRSTKFIEEKEFKLVRTYENRKNEAQ